MRLMESYFLDLIKWRMDEGEKLVDIAYDLLENVMFSYEDFLEVTGMTHDEVKIYEFKKFALKNYPYSDEIKTELAKIVIKTEVDFEYVDNYRFAILGDSDEEKKYKEILSQGCCGFHDFVVEIEEKKYKIGFNHGH
jgi:hypothetical protein